MSQDEEQIIITVPMTEEKPAIEKQKSKFSERKVKTLCGLAIAVFCIFALTNKLNLQQTQTFKEFDYEDFKKISSNDEIQNSGAKWISKEKYSQLNRELNLLKDDVKAEVDVDDDPVYAIRTRNSNILNGDIFYNDNDKEHSKSLFDFFKLKIIHGIIKKMKEKVFANEGSDFYRCRVQHQTSSRFNNEKIWIPGYADGDVCKYSYGYKGFESKNFEVLYK